MEASEALQVIASPRRLKILELAWDRELSAGEIARNFDVTWSAISQHITVLKSAGFLVERREGTSRLYRTDKEGLGPLRDVVEAQWRAGLMQVKSLAEQEHARGKETR
ncbi:MAG TPA: metalloregulator ArsR/SmtB family transcription factor [Streptosporangiaceae bacterium]